MNDGNIWGTLKMALLIMIVFLLYMLLSLFCFIFIFGREDIIKASFLRKNLNKLFLKHKELREKNLKNYYSHNRKQIDLKVGNKTVSCKYIKADKHTCDTIICCHGYKSNHERFISGFFDAYGGDVLLYNLCVFDFPGCGNSSGFFISMGKTNALLLEQIVEQAKVEFGLGIRVFIHGVSFGAYQALNALCNYTMPKDIKGLIVDSALTDPIDYINKATNSFLIKTLKLPLTFWYRLFYKESFDSIKTNFNALNIPLIVFHGSNDEIIPLENVDNLFRTPSFIQTVFVEGADHGMICLEHSEMYRHKLLRFTQNLHKNRVALIGFMSAGKTTLGKMLAQKYNLSCVDIDEEVCAFTNKTLDELFSTSEVEFRKIELKTLKEQKDRDSVILACGGGTPQIDGSFSYLKEWSIIWLDVSAETAFFRSSMKKFARPKEGFLQLCDSRMPIFEGLFDFLISTDGDLKSTFEELDKLINKHHILVTNLNADEK